MATQINGTPSPPGELFCNVSQLWPQNLNDDEGGGGPSEDEYDALNDETFGADSELLDWEVEHEQLAEQLESSRRHNHNQIDSAASDRLEASLSQLVLDEPDTPQPRTLGSSVWRHDFPTTPVAAPLKNVCTVEELERQLRQKPPQHMQQFQQNYYQPRFPPVILQRPPGLQAPVPLPFAPQQPMGQMGQINQPLNKPISQTNMSQTNILQNQMAQNVNQMGQNVNQMGQNMNQIGPNLQMSQNVNQLNQNMNQFMQNANQMSNFQNNQSGQNNLMNMCNMQVSQLLQNVNQMGQNIQMNQNVNQNVNQMNQMAQNMNQMTQNVNQLGHNMNQITQNASQIGQNMSQMGQNVNQMIPNGNQFNAGMNQFPHMMGQPRMMAPPPGMNMPRQNFNPNMGQYNTNFRGPTIQSKPEQQLNQQNLLMNQQLQQLKNQSTQISQNQLANQQQIPQNQNALSQPPIGQNTMTPNSMVQNPIGQNQQNVTGQAPINQTTMGQTQNHLGHNQMTQNQMAQNQMSQNQMVQTQMAQNQIVQNQMGQNAHQNFNQTLNQKTANKIQTQNNVPQNQKLQKSRVYNNSNTKTLTSQNLVQIIQNTHPMLQNQALFNNSYHNANHHPMLNRNNMFNNQFNGQFNNNIFNNLRHNGTYSNSTRHSINGDDASTSSEGDEYAGLMTQREKQWLINIQMLQLSTGTPYIHDFYYTVFLERQANKEKEGIKEAHKANQQNHPFYSGGVKQETHTRERHNSARHNSTGDDASAPRTYVPTQFENSLGKLQCGSVTAPRKIIDVEVCGVGEPSAPASRAPSVASTTNPNEIPRELRRTKQLLLEIEALYLILLRLEELNDPLAISNALILKEREEKQKQLELAQKEALENEQEEDSNVFLRNIESVQRRPKQDSPKSDNIDKRQVVNLSVGTKPAPMKNLLDEDKEELIGRIFAGLLHQDRLVQVLGVRKGRALVSRFVARVPCGHARLRPLWQRVLRAIPSAARRDPTGLAALAPHYRKFIQNTTGWSAILESCSLLGEAFDPARTPYALTTPLTLSCVCALIERASILVNTPELTSNERQWSKFLKTLARALKNTTLTVARPVQPLPETRLIQHLKQLESRTTIEILQRGKTATEFADITKMDVSEQLVKHLC